MNNNIDTKNGGYTYNYAIPTDQYKLKDGVLYRKVITQYRKVIDQTSRHALSIIEQLLK